MDRWVVKIQGGPPGLYALVGRPISVTATRPKRMGLKVPGDTMVFWWPAETDPDTYDADHGRAMDMAGARYTELYGEAPEAEIIGKLAGSPSRAAPFGQAIP